MLRYKYYMSNNTQTVSREQHHTPELHDKCGSNFIQNRINYRILFDIPQSENCLIFFY